METIYISCQEAKRLLGYKNHNSINYLVQNNKLNEYTIGPLKRKLYNLWEVQGLQKRHKGPAVNSIKNERYHD
jgi:hypothetical protein